MSAQLTINGKIVTASIDVGTIDLVQIDTLQWHAIYKGKSYKLGIENLNKEEKTIQLKLNGKLISVQIEDKYDLLLKQMGYSKAGTQKQKLIKAPMPGLVIKLLVKAGDEVKKGESLLVLEAMKMENNIKATADAVIKRIAVSEKTAVEKNQLLIELE